MSSERRLHPLSAVFDTIRHLPRFAMTLVPLFFVVITSTRKREAVLFLVAPGAVILGLTTLAAIISYFRFTYRYDTSDLVIRSGLFTRNERRIPYARIQNLDATQDLLHRLFGVAVVHVQTGGGVAPEASLRVIPLADLQEMRARVLGAGGGATDSPAAFEPADPEVALAAGERARPRTLLALSPRDLLLAGFLENRGMVLVVGALALLEQSGAFQRVAERFATDDVAATGQQLLGQLGIVRGSLYVLTAMLLGLLLVRLLSTIWAVVRLYDFKLMRDGDELHMEYGLFTRVSATIPLHRVQSVIVHDSMLHRVFGRHVVSVVTAGGVAGAGEVKRREPVAPILRADQLGALLDQLQPGLDLDLITWQPVDPRAFTRMLRGSLLLPIALSIGAAFVIDAWALGILVLLLTRTFVRSRLRARYLAWSITPDSIIARDGALTRYTRIARFSRVQVVSLDRGPFDVRMRMASVHADTAGRGGVKVPYLSEETAAMLRGDLVARTAATAFTW